jgi:hypothetical protein
MTKNLNIKLIAAAFVAASAATLFSMGSANASMSAELQNCKTNSRSQTTHCCQAIVKQNLPIWMRETGRNCATSVVCVGKRKGGSALALANFTPPKNSCYIAFELDYTDGGSDKHRQPRSQRRSANK